MPRQPLYVVHRLPHLSRKLGVLAQLLEERLHGMASSLPSPTRATASALGGYPLKARVEGVADRHGDEDGQQHPEDEDQRDPDANARVSASPASTSARHAGILHQGPG